ncbi:MAG: 16S rRNA (guanine(527)-N(7))-methyltransferase RsmG [Nitrospirae bacterium]|nr:16S rRNA (guanine(527)-N(7))-methyltransferase RsmG [Nitrospirota bacterium]
METDDFSRQLSAAARNNGFVPDEAALNRFVLYRNELVKWGRVINLSSKLTDRDIIYTHFIDSFIYLNGLTGEHCQRIADIGSGAGFPGIPMALMRQGYEFDLIEPRHKRASFLNHIKRTLNLKNVRVINERIENVADDIKYNAIVTRASLGLEELYTLTRNRLMESGRIIVSMGPTYIDKVKNLTSGYEIKKYKIEGEDVDRWLIILISGQVPRGT